jgi:hypothetical protein
MTGNCRRSNKPDERGPEARPGLHEDVFRRFFRLDDARNPDEGGTELGLAAALDIARSHGGDISLGDSKAGVHGRLYGCRCELRKNAGPRGGAPRPDKPASSFVPAAGVEKMLHGRRPAAVWQNLAKKPSGEIIDLAGRSDNLITLQIASN